MTASMLSTLNLLQTKFAFINACGSGKGKTSIGMPVGIPSALRYAGVQAIITTSWGIEDKSALQFVDNFYSNLIDGRSFYSSQRQSKLRMVREGRHPYYWAAYQLSF